MYLIFGLSAGIVGSILSLIIRIELSNPFDVLLLGGQLYNVIITAHGLIMVFFMIMPILIWWIW